MAIKTDIYNATDAWNVYAPPSTEKVYGLTFPEFSALFEYYQELSNELGTDIELDPVAWLCDTSVVEPNYSGVSEWEYLLNSKKELSESEKYEKIIKAIDNADDLVLYKASNGYLVISI